MSFRVRKKELQRGNGVGKVGVFSGKSDGEIRVVYRLPSAINFLDGRIKLCLRWKKKPDAYFVVNL